MGDITIDIKVDNNLGVQNRIHIQVLCIFDNGRLSAVAGTEDEEADKYFVIRAPHMKDHVCSVI